VRWKTRSVGPRFFCQFALVMFTIVITGGVACGKSGFSRRFLRLAGEEGVALIDCDEIVRELYQDAAFAEQLIAEAAAHDRKVRGIDGKLDRVTLRELLFDNSRFRVRVEGMVHPLVFQRIIAQLNGLSDRVRMALIEVPLLYEVNFPLRRDLDLVVAASRRTQRLRLLEDRGLEPPLAERILDAQMPLDEKIRKCDITVWNDGSVEAFEAQVGHLYKRCETIFT
jgi:dephospho-CoA kinase